MSTFTFNDTFLTTLKADLATTRISPALMGDPGIGKTSFLKGLESFDNHKVFVLSVNTLADKGDLTGVRTVPTPDGKSYHQQFFPHATILEANEYAEANPDDTVILLLDEINRGSDDLPTAVMSLVTERRAGHLRLADNIRFVVTGNTEGNIVPLDSATLTRFSIYNVRADAQIFIDYMGDRLNRWIKSVLEKKPSTVQCRPVAAPTIASIDDDDDDKTESERMADAMSALSAEEDMVQQTNPRTLEGLSNWFSEFSNEDIHRLINESADDGLSVLHHILISHTGDTEFTQMLERTIIEELTASSNTTRNGSNVTATMSVDKPDDWKFLTSISSVPSLIQYFEDQSDENCQQAILYAMTDGHDDAMAPRLVSIMTSNNLVGALSNDNMRVMTTAGLNGVLRHADQIAPNSDFDKATTAVRSLF